jgi:hypothetical protein
MMKRMMMMRIGKQTKAKRRWGSIKRKVNLIRRIRIVSSLGIVMTVMMTMMEMIRGTEMTPIDRRLGRR